MTNNNNAVDSREKLEVDLKTRLYEFGGYCFTSREIHTDNVDTFFDDFVSLLDRQGAITEREMQAKVDELTAERDAKADLLATAFERVKELEAERDDAVEAYDAHMAAHDAWHEAEDITYTRNRFAIYEQATKERIARLEAERDALQAENMSLKANSDECVPRAIKKRDEVIKILESERDEARAKCAELEAEANGLVGQIGDVEGSLLIAQSKNRELREKLSQAIGHASDIIALQDLTAVDMKGETKP